MLARFVFSICALGICALASLTGCSNQVSSKTEGLEDLQPVMGSVSFDGKPTPGAIVLFFESNDPKPDGIRISGEVDEDGDFEMLTGVSQGALPGVRAGSYFVTVTWTRPENADDKDSDLIDLIPAKYGSPKTSPLRVVIKDGENALKPFVLTAKEIDTGD